VSCEMLALGIVLLLCGEVIFLDCVIIKVVRVRIRSRIDFQQNRVIASNRRISNSTRFLSQESIHVEILYASIEKVKILSIKIYSNMVYTSHLHVSLF
jgi:hypothetical protein